MTNEVTQVEVHLAVYDLSQGMARTFSAQVLGPNHSIDIIPHTSVLCFGQEYFFGSGIQSMNPEEFRLTSGIGRPIQIISLGFTSQTKQQLDSWCQVNTRYTMATYDLLNCNCNHFSNDCALEGLHLSKGVPDWILRIPQQFLSSPMGQMIRPMLEQMQLSTRSIGNRHHQQTPTYANQHNMMRLQQNSQRQQPPTPTTTTTTTTKIDNNTTNYNPWANNVSTTNNTTTEASSSSVAVAAPAPPKTKSDDIITANPIIKKPNVSLLLKKYSKPLLSNDTQTIPICIKKLRPHIIIKPPRDENLTLFQEDFSSRLIEALAMVNSNSSSSRSTDKALQTIPSEEEGKPTISDEELSLIVSELFRLLQEESKATSFALLLLRLIVLLLPLPSSSFEGKTTTILYSCIKWMIQHKFSTESKTTTTTTSAWKTPVERSLAWCVLSNYVAAHISNNNSDNDDMSTSLSLLVSSSVIIDSAITDLNTEKQQPVSVRQAAAAFLCNYILLLSTSTNNNAKRMQLDEDEDGMILVSLLCSSLENLMEESDTTTRLRRILIGGRIIIFPSDTANNGDGGDENNNNSLTNDDMEYCNNTVKDLVKDLGFIDILQSVVVATVDNNNNIGSVEENDCQAVASDLLYRLLH